MSALVWCTIGVLNCRFCTLSLRLAAEDAISASWTVPPLVFCSTPNSAELLPLDRAKHLCLTTKPHLANFVEKERPGIGELENARLLLVRAGKLKAPRSCPKSSFSRRSSDNDAQLSGRPQWPQAAHVIARQLKRTIDTPAKLTASRSMVSTNVSTPGRRARSAPRSKSTTERLANPGSVQTNNVAHSRQDKFAQSGAAQFVIQHLPDGFGALHSHGTVEDLFRALA